MVLAPVVIDKKGAFEHIPEQFQRLGFARARVDGVVYGPRTKSPNSIKNYKHTIEIVVDRIVNDTDSRTALAQSVEVALDLADNKLLVHHADAPEGSERDTVFSLMYACTDHPDVQIPDLEPRTFSFNSPHGACPVCTALATAWKSTPNLSYQTAA